MSRPGTRNQRAVAILKRLLAATRSGALVWTQKREAKSDWLMALNERILVRYLWIESVNQIGADPLIAEIHMPGFNGAFACGTEGYDLICEIRCEAFGGDLTTDYATRFLDEAIPPAPRRRRKRPLSLAELHMQAPKKAPRRRRRRT